MGAQPFYRHLVSSETDAAASKADESLDARIQAILDISPDDFSPEVPLTAYGLDSLSAARLSHALRPLIAVTQMQLLGGISTNELRKRIDALLVDDPKPAAPDVQPRTSADVMRDLLNELSVDLHRVQPTATLDTLPTGYIVLLTGTTGALGSALLAYLVSLPSVYRIFAVNRNHSGEALEERQRRALAHHGFDIPMHLLPKITQVGAALHEPRFGMEKELYDEVWYIQVRSNINTYGLSDPVVCDSHHPQR